MAQQLALQVAPDLIGFEAEIDGQEELGRGIEVTGSLPAAVLPGPQPQRQPCTEWSLIWWLLISISDALLRFVANESVPLTSGRGDVEVEQACPG